MNKKKTAYWFLCSLVLLFASMQSICVTRRLMFANVGPVLGSGI